MKTSSRTLLVVVLKNPCFVVSHQKLNFRVSVQLFSPSKSSWVISWKNWVNHQPRVSWLLLDFSCFLVALLYWPLLFWLYSRLLKAFLKWVIVFVLTNKWRWSWRLLQATVNSSSIGYFLWTLFMHQSFRDSRHPHSLILCGHMVVIPFKNVHNFYFWKCQFLAIYILDQFSQFMAWIDAFWTICKL